MRQGLASRTVRRLRVMPKQLDKSVRVIPERLNVEGPPFEGRASAGVPRKMKSLRLQHLRQLFYEGREERRICRHGAPEAAPYICGNTDNESDEGDELQRVQQCP